jgi:hypothetical protein
MSSQLQEQFEFYLIHQDEFVEQYDGKYVVIHNDEVVGVYDDDLTAVMEAQKAYQMGTFLVQKVSAGDAEYSQTFHSRVVFT